MFTQGMSINAPQGMSFWSEETKPVTVGVMNSTVERNRVVTITLTFGLLRLVFSLCLSLSIRLSV